MRLWPMLSLPSPCWTVVAQIPTVPPPSPSPAHGLPPEAIYGGGAALVLLFALVVARLLRRPRPPAPPPAALPEQAPILKVELPPSEQETARLGEAAEAQREAEALAQQRR